MNKNNLNKDALKHIKSVNWEPSWGLQRIESMLTDRPIGVSLDKEIGVFL
jgi:isoleucyl-tRNA synthetase